MATPLHTPAVLASTGANGEFRLLAMAFLAVMASLCWELAREAWLRLRGKGRLQVARR